MKILSIDDPNDLYYPLDKETYNDPTVYYHGTSKQFSTSIEEKGFHLKKVYDQTDVSNLYNAFSAPYFKKMNFEEMDFQKEDLTFAIGGASDSISFSGDYWYARNYSIYRGGESIEHIVKMCKWISKLPNCPFKELAENCLEKYGPIFENHVPCLYVVKLSDNELEEWTELAQENQIDQKEARIMNIDHFVHNQVSNKSIIARIDFSKKIKRWHPGWDGDRQFHWSEE
jgi:hypothetical protein